MPQAGLFVVACGQGRMSRHLAGLGRRWSESTSPLPCSAAHVPPAPDEIACVRADISGHTGWWDGRSFDGCTCELALMDIDDLAGALSTVTTVLRKGGWFVASIVHPSLPDRENGLSRWPPGAGYDSEGRWISPGHSPDGARIRVGRNPPQAVHLPECLARRRARS